MTTIKLKGNVTSSGTQNTEYSGIGNESWTYNGSTAGPVYMYGSTGADTLTNSGTNVTSAFIYGGSGGSKLNGGSVTGTEYIYGRAGSDLITTTSGNAIVYGGASGNDSMYIDGTVTGSGFGLAVTATGGGNATISGGAGRDVIALGDNSTQTSVHHHYLYGGTGNTIISAGGDNRSAATDVNAIYGGSGNDTILGSVTGFDIINAGVGTDVIVGNSTNFTAFNTVAVPGTAPAASENLTFAWAGSAYSNGTVASGGLNHAGVTVNLQASSVTVNGTTYTNQAGAGTATMAGWQSSSTATATSAISDTFTGINNVYGTSYNDSITGSTGANALWSLMGNDTIDAGGANSSTAGYNLGNDTIHGGYAGNKLFVMHNGTQGTQAAAVAGDVIIGGTGSDTLDFSGTVAFGAGLASSVVGASYNSIAAGVINGEYVNMSFGTNLTTQSGFAVNFAGNAGEGTISNVAVVQGSLANTNFMVGNTGVTLMGGYQNDTLVGGSNGGGHDVLVGQGTIVGGGTIYDGTSSFMSNYFEIGNDTSVGINFGSATGGALTSYGSVTLAAGGVNALVGMSTAPATVTGYTGVVAGLNMDTIYGFSEQNGGDRLYVKTGLVGDYTGTTLTTYGNADLASFGTINSTVATESGGAGVWGTANAANHTITYDTGVFTDTYSTIKNAAGTYSLMSVALDGVVTNASNVVTSTGAVLNGTGSAGNWTATSALYTGNTGTQQTYSLTGLTVTNSGTSHGEFLFDQATGNVYWDSNNLATGTTSVALYTVTEAATTGTATAASQTIAMAAGITQVAHIDLGTATAFNGSPLTVLSAGDFALSA